MQGKEKPELSLESKANQEKLYMQGDPVVYHPNLNTGASERGALLINTPE